MRSTRLARLTRPDRLTQAVRKEQLHIWFYTEERNLLYSLAERSGMSCAQVIRQLIRQEHKRPRGKALILRGDR